MSCHDIGRGMNYVVRRTITLYDQKKIALEPAKKIIASCTGAVYWCDGNSDEAINFIRRCRCGKCLKLVPKGEKLYSIWKLPYPTYKGHYEWLSKIEEELELASDGLCEECFEQYMPSFCDGELDLEAMKRELEEKYPQYAISEGKYPIDNNGYFWREDEYWYEL
jgi:hypothetical protein